MNNATPRKLLKEENIVHPQYLKYSYYFSIKVERIFPGLTFKIDCLELVQKISSLLS
jgi:hypothetical protein